MMPIPDSCFRKIDESVYEYVASGQKWPQISKAISDDYNVNGYVIVRKLFDESEIGKLNTALTECDHFKRSAFGLKDTDDLSHHQNYWTEPGNDILGLAAGNAKTVGISEQLLGQGEMYIYNASVIMKQPFTGGALLWHQDYGYWYNNRACFPHFVTCCTALTKSDSENGGLQVIKGSNHCGRINHGVQAGQTGADLERVELIKQKLPKVQVNLSPGDCVFFTPVTLHSSEANKSEHKRWHLIYCYCAKSNSPDRKHYSACYTPLPKYPADCIKHCKNLEIEERTPYDPSINRNTNLNFEK